MKTYGTNDIAGTTLTAREADTAAVSLGFSARMVVVGGYDESNGTLASSKESTPVYVADSSAAADLFGDGSELYHQVRLAYLNGAIEVYAVAVPETSETESFTTTDNDTLSNVPFDPRLHSEHSFTVTDTVESASVTVNLVDDTPTAPSDANTMEINPTTGEWYADESSDYDIEYTYGDYTTAVDNAAEYSGMRFVVGLTEDTSTIETLLSDVNDQGSVFDFKRAVAGVPPKVDPSTYSDSYDDQRLVLAAGSRGFTDDGTGEQMVRLAGPVAAQMTGTELGRSATGNQLAGITRLHTPLRSADATNFGSGSEVTGVTPVINDRGPVKIGEDLTTSEGDKFRDVYRCEIVDDLAYALNGVADNYLGDANIPDNREARLQVPMERVCEAASNLRPPLLSVAFEQDEGQQRPADKESGDTTEPTATDSASGTASGESTDSTSSQRKTESEAEKNKPYDINVAAGATDEDVVVDAGIDVTGVAKRIDITLSVGPLAQFGGAE